MIQENGEHAGRNHEDAEFGGFHEILGPVFFKRFKHTMVSVRPRSRRRPRNRSSFLFREDTITTTRARTIYQLDIGVTKGISWRCSIITVNPLMKVTTAMQKSRPWSPMIE